MKHRFQLDADGNIDDFVVDAGYCNGPACSRCNGAWCHHCNPGVYEEECPGDRYQQAGQLSLFDEETNEQTYI